VRSCARRALDRLPAPFWLLSADRQPGFGEPGLKQAAVQPEQQRRDIGSGPVSRLLRPLAALPQHRPDKLLDERYVPAGLRGDGAQVPCLHAVPRERGHCRRHIEGLLPV
jgi:hypothetical protein